MFPSYQQEVAAVGYLSSIDLAQKMANLTLYLIRSDFYNTKNRIVNENVEDTKLSCQNLNIGILENGSYKIIFDQCGVICRHPRFLEQNLEIDWNDNAEGFHQFNYHCEIRYPIDQLRTVANFIIEPIGNQKNRNPKLITLMMVCKFSI